MKRWPNNWAPKPNISFNSMKVFDECERKWLYQYAPTHIARQFDYDLQAQARLMPWYMLGGQVVDDVIREALRFYRDTQQWPTNLPDRANEILREYSKRTNEYLRKYRRGQINSFGGRQPVDRIFFEDVIDRAEVRVIRDNVRLCLENFAQSGIMDFIAHYPTSSWRITEPAEVQPVPWFWVENMPVYASYDFAIVMPEDTLLFEWKTGKKSSDSEARVLEQLHGYAAYAISEWKVPPEQITLIVFWLAGKLDWQTFSVDPNLLELIIGSWRSRYNTLVERARLCGEDLGQWFQMFPLTPNVYRCRHCPFRACKGYKRLENLPAGWAAEEDVELLMES